MMRGLVLGFAIWIIASDDATACKYLTVATPKGLSAAHIVAKLRLVDAVQLSEPPARRTVLLTFETLQTYSGEEQDEWRLIWLDGRLEWIGMPPDFKLPDHLPSYSAQRSDGEFVETPWIPPFRIDGIFIVGITRPEILAHRRCAPDLNRTSCVSDGHGGYFPEIMTSLCNPKSTGFAFQFDRALEGDVTKILDAAQ